MDLTIELHFDGEWHDAAVLTLEAPDAGVKGGTKVDYDNTYYFANGMQAYNDGMPLVDARAVSLRYPLDMSTKHLKAWPTFVQDLLPQGEARSRLMRHLDLNDGDPRAALALLMRAGGSPIGNMRIHEAWSEEKARLTDAQVPGVTARQIFDRSDEFLDVSHRFTMIASGSKGLQGEWPKVAMTLASDGLWYPDPVVPDEDARDHAIVKMVRSDAQVDWDILASESPFLEIARRFGLDVARPLEYREGVLLIPRFDRVVTEGGVVRRGQESLFSANGITDFEQLRTHEGYLETLKVVASDPRAAVIEYVLRDVLNQALGNRDNHGRNTAWAKDARGWVGLSPVFDLAPMALAPSRINRTTRWKCAGGKDHDPDWAVVCGEAAEGVMPAEELMETLLAAEPFIRGLPTLARELAVPEHAIDRSLMSERVADGLAELAAPLHRRAF